MWVLGIKARASGRAAIAFSCWEIFPAQRMMEMLWTLCTVNFHCQPSCRTWDLEARSVTSGVQSSGSKAATGVSNLSPTLVLRTLVSPESTFERALDDSGTLACNVLWHLIWGLAILYHFIPTVFWELDLSCVILKTQPQRNLSGCSHSTARTGQ